MRTDFSFINKYFVPIFLVLPLLFLLSQFVEQLAHNYHSVELIKQLSGESSCNNLDIEFQTAECFRVLKLDAYEHGYALSLEMEQLITAYLSLGVDNGHACEIMMRVGAKTRLIEPLSVATNELDWVGVEDCLAIIESISHLPGFISPHQVSFSYNGLANYYLKTGNLNRAAYYFQKAVDWHPALWAEPVIQLASIYESKGSWLQAEQTLLVATQHAKDHWNLYRVLKSLAAFWLSQNETEAAYCAYYFAVQSGTNSPSKQVSEQDLQSTKDQLGQLQHTVKLSHDICQSMLFQKGVTFLPNE